MMELRKLAKDVASAPFTRHVMLDLLKDYSRPNDKISELVRKGELVAVKRGLYVPSHATGLPIPEPFVVANHLWGPSYVSMESALSYWGAIPEQVFEVSSATLKNSKTYRTPIGRFSYRRLPVPYYSFGITRVSLSAQQAALVASLEKALCDKISLTPGIVLRSIKQTTELLLDDLRIDGEVLKRIDLGRMHSWANDAPKESSIRMLIKTIEHL